jgi:hypothetical protein
MNGNSSDGKALCWREFGELVSWVRGNPTHDVECATPPPKADSVVCTLSQAPLHTKCHMTWALSIMSPLQSLNSDAKCISEDGAISG